MQIMACLFILPIGAGNTMDTTIPVDGYVRVLGHCYHTDGDDKLDNEI
jgi:hypothetical protein